MRLSNALGLSILLLPVLALAAADHGALRIHCGAHRSAGARRAHKRWERERGAETAVLAGGCFWGVQAVYQHTKGVTQRRVGLCRRRRQGRGLSRPCSYGRTGHAEAVRGHLRSARDLLRQIAADLLLGRARPDPAQPAGAGLRHAIPLRDLRADRSTAGASPRPISRSSTRATCSGSRS